jgi:hypothetical protein
VDNDTIKKLALAHGFELKPQVNGETDLNPSVYDFAKALAAESNKPLNTHIEKLEHQAELTVLATHEATLNSDYGKRWLDKFSLMNKIEELSKLRTQLGALGDKGTNHLTFALERRLDQLREALHRLEAQ